MIYIEQEEHKILPKEFINSHNFCVILYDLIFETISHKAFKELYSSKFEFQSESVADLEGLKSKETQFLEWLKLNRKDAEIVEILSKRILTGIVPDMLQFIYEGLSCSMRGKTTVTFSNFRKPINENLVVLERLYHDKESYIKDFYFEAEVKKFDPTSKKLDKKEIIREVLEKFENPLFSFLSEELIYDLRFSKDSNGFNPLFNKAIHIVTNDPNYRTELTNFNFVFSDKEDIYKQWKFIYSFFPYLMIYITNLVLYLADELLELDSDLIQNRELKVFSGAICWFNEKENFKEVVKKTLEIFEKTDIECPKCGMKANLDIHDFKLIYETGIRPCLNCLSSIIPYSDTLIPDIYNHKYSKKDFDLSLEHKFLLMINKIKNYFCFRKKSKSSLSPKNIYTKSTQSPK